MVFTRVRLAVFIDGCFWHECEAHYQRPSANGDYWDTKLKANIHRDAATNIKLTARGWTVLRFWEHQVIEDFDKVVASILAAYSDLRSVPRTENSIT